MKGPNPTVLSPISRNLRKPLTRRPPLAPLVPLVPVPRCGAAVSGDVLPRRCATAKAPFIHYATSIFARNRTVNLANSSNMDMVPCRGYLPSACPTDT